jgi:hypothetical protein
MGKVNPARIIMPEPSKNIRSQFEREPHEVYIDFGDGLGQYINLQEAPVVDDSYQKYYKVQIRERYPWEFEDMNKYFEK